MRDRLKMRSSALSLPRSNHIARKAPAYRQTDISWDPTLILAMLDLLMELEEKLMFRFRSTWCRR
jgi:hypothetical protein